MIGALIWGIMGDRLGRRRTLLTALASNGIFGVIAAFMPTYSLLMLTRFCSSVGEQSEILILNGIYKNVENQLASVEATCDDPSRAPIARSAPRLFTSTTPGGFLTNINFQSQFTFSYS
ncbi:synaptic vesicle glycoprotein 2C [Trichonephila clavipes]|nr:synaptic vesicle glycoprotein 2C [Trichonephila clavipes]